MTISAEIIADSISAENGIRLTSFILKYPRFIHSEVMTHRAFSRNASSSRAIPFRRQLKMIVEDMARPSSFKQNKPGMQAGDDLGVIRQYLCNTAWRAAGYASLGFAICLDKLGAHKQYVNRIIEPFSHITVVVSGTDDAYANFFALRCHKDAQPEIHTLALCMRYLYQARKPNLLNLGQWHLPFVSDEEKKMYDWKTQIKMSVARCARTSYMNHDGSRADVDKDIALHDLLVGSFPMHASPAEHQAKCVYGDVGKFGGNLNGWVQYRKTLVGEYVGKDHKHGDNNG